MGEPGCGPGGIQTRAVWCAHVEGWTTLHTNCKPAERPSNQQNCFKVCDWHKELSRLEAGRGIQCQRWFQKPGETPGCVKGEEGIQVREITCVEKERCPCGGYHLWVLRAQAAGAGLPHPLPAGLHRVRVFRLVECSKTCDSGLQHPGRASCSRAPSSVAQGARTWPDFRCASPALRGRERMYSLQVGPWSHVLNAHSRQVRQARRRGRVRAGQGPREGVKDPEARELIRRETETGRTVKRTNTGTSRLDTRPEGTMREQDGESCWFEVRYLSVKTTR